MDAVTGGTCACTRQRLLATMVKHCRKPRMTPSRDYDEQRPGILYSLLKSEYLR